MRARGWVLVSELRAGDPQAIGPYRLVGELGQGGMGRVYLGVSPGGRPVAVKAIRAELAADPEFRSRFGREVASARRVSGVYTAQVVDADVDGPVAWMATAYVPGPSLAEAVDTHGPLPEASLLALAAGLAESLNAIHAAGVVHRDLKPSNVLLAEDGPRVIDFGISRAVEAVTMLTQAGLVVGSPGFMSPEQAMGGEVGPPSDVFNLGAVLAFAATGEGPFGTGTTAALLYRVAHGEPGLERVPPRVRPLIERCLAKDPAQRPTASGLLSEVGALQPDGNWLPDSLTRTFAANAAPGSPFGATGAPAFGLSRPGFAPTGGPAFAPTRGPGYGPSNPRYAPSNPGYAPSDQGFAPTSGPGLAAPGPVPAPSSGSGFPPLGPGLAAYAAPEPGLTPTRTTAAGAGTLPTPPRGYASPTPPPGYGQATPRRATSRRLRPVRLDDGSAGEHAADPARGHVRPSRRREPATAPPGAPAHAGADHRRDARRRRRGRLRRDRGHQAPARPAQRPPGRGDVLGPGPLVERPDQRLPVSLAKHLVERPGVHTPAGHRDGDPDPHPNDVHDADLEPDDVAYYLADHVAHHVSDGRHHLRARLDLGEHTPVLRPGLDRHHLHLGQHFRQHSPIRPRVLITARQRPLGRRPLRQLASAETTPIPGRRTLDHERHLLLVTATSQLRVWRTQRGLCATGAPATTSAPDCHWRHLRCRTG